MERVGAADQRQVGDALKCPGQQIDHQHIADVEAGRRARVKVRDHGPDPAPCAEACEQLETVRCGAAERLNQVYSNAPFVPGRERRGTARKRQSRGYGNMTKNQTLEAVSRGGAVKRSREIGNTETPDPAAVGSGERFCGDKWRRRRDSNATICALKMPYFYDDSAIIGLQ